MKFKIFSLTNLLLLLIFLGGGLLFAIEVKPFLYYHFHEIGFSSGFDYLKPFLRYTGGVSDYVTNFVTRYFAFNLVGSLLYALLIAASGLLAADLIRRTTGTQKLTVLVFGAFFVLGLYSACDYYYPYQVATRLLLAIAFSWLYGVLETNFPKWSIYVWFALVLLLFWLASGAALIVFGVTTALVVGSLRKQKQWASIGLGFVAFSAILPYWAYRFVTPQTLDTLYKIVDNKSGKMIADSTVYGLYLNYALLPVFLLAAALLANRGMLEASSIKAGKSKSGAKKIYQTTQFALVAQFLVIAVAGYFLVIKTVDPFKRKLLTMEYYAENSDWNNVLKTAETIENYNTQINFQVNRAYANLGKLPEYLFNFPQYSGSKGLFLDLSDQRDAFTIQTSDLYFDLGFMSESLHWAFESQTLNPVSPRALKRIILIYLVNGNYDRAERFMNVLAKNSLQKDWVEKYRAYLKNPNLIAGDPVLAQKRKFATTRQIVSSDPEDNLALLLETNKRNRLAYDYLNSLFLLNLNLNGFVNLLKDYTYYGFKTLPRSWEEGVAYYAMQAKTFPAFISESDISKKCIDRFTSFSNIVNSSKSKNEAQAKLGQNFGNTYWYYVLFINPETNNQPNK